MTLNKEKRKVELLHKELSYQIQGAAIEVRKNFGPGHKENLYQEAFTEELQGRNIPFEQQRTIKIYSPKTGKLLRIGYRPDFIIDKKLLLRSKHLLTFPIALSIRCMTENVE